MTYSSFRFIVFFCLAGVCLAGHVAQAASVKLEAESGTRGTNFIIGTDVAIQYITVTNSVGIGNPGSAARVVTFNVTFPEAGAYKFFARLRVGPATFSDDSLFYGNGFGAKSPASNGDWIQMNGLASAGYVGGSDVVTNNGSAGSQVWKWVNLSDFSNGGEAPISFNVPADNLTQTFQIAGREDGLWIDAILFGTAGFTFTVAELDAGGPGNAPPPPPPPRSRDLVAGNLIQFGDNGAWSWYMDERAVVDAAGGRLIVGWDASDNGVGGSPRNGAIEANVYDLQTGARQQTVLLPSGVLGCDDHNAPAFMVRGDGKYLAQYAGHNNNFLTYFNIYDGNAWESQTTFDWAGVGAINGEQTSYSNPYYLSAENRVYSFVRCIENRSPHFLVSSNNGDTWTYGGQLVEPDGVVGYNSGYFRYSGNGVDRIDFICTEAHPRDILTSIYHGYVSNGMSFRTDGTVVDTNIFDRLCPVSRNFQPVFTNGTVMPLGQTNYRCWNSDVNRYADGTVNAIIHARINQNASGGYPDTVDPNHAFFFCRYDGTNWSTTYLCQAGHKMYSAEADYVGLGAVHPSDANTIYISTRYDPRAVQAGVSDTNQPHSEKREIWKGVTTNHGASFTWTEVTRESVADNFRPIIPAWEGGKTVLLWNRGTYLSAQNYDAAVVGIVERDNEVIGLATYVDAAASNTTFTNGSPLVTTGPDANPGADDDQWHLRTGFGNGGTVLASSETGNGENAPALKTHVTTGQAGTHEVWVNFWADPTSDWRIKAGLSADGMQAFRQMASKGVETGAHNPTILVSNVGAIFLYQAYLGRVTNGSFDVFVDDESIQTGTTSTSVGDTARTWYDGLSYALVQMGGAYDQWASSHGLSGDDALPGFDFDDDGFPNAVEFILAGDPSVADSETIKPLHQIDGTNFVYEFRRAESSEVSQGYMARVYYSTDLNGWSEAADGMNGVAVTVENDFYGTGLDKVSVQIPNTVSPGGQLYVRLGVTPIP
jgi:hypothetical protein